MKIIYRVILGLTLPLAILAAWWFTSSNSTSGFYPPLAVSLKTFAHMWFFKDFTSDLLPTVEWFYVGLAMGWIAGLILGVGLGLSRGFRRDVLPLTEFARAIPTAGLVPLALALFGPGFWTETTLGATAVFFQVVISTMDGVRSVDPVNLDVAKCYGLTRTRRLFRVVLPAATPQIMSGARIGISIGIAAVVIADMLGSSQGVGFQLVNAQTSYDIPAMWSALFMIGILGFLLNAIFLVFEYRLLAWHRGWRGTGVGVKGGRLGQPG
jgi:ABC-type nitrate/sulfonate/bicarbonate transport system permease component